MIAIATGGPIDEVIEKLEEVVKWSVQLPSRVGYFASLYLRVTNTIRSKIGTGYFDDDSRMERLDANFAGRYLDAVRLFQASSPALPAAWAVAMNATSQNSPIILQQLLVAMNAHINIDLGVASAQTCPGDSIHALKSDFMKINSVLAGIVPTLLSEIGALSPAIGLLDTAGGKAEIDLIDLVMSGARDLAWDFAVKLAGLPENSWKPALDERNWAVAMLGKQILSPGLILAEVFELVRKQETSNVAQVINTLNSGNPVQAVVPETALAEEVSGVFGTGQRLANQIYYFETGAGVWTGRFTFGMTSWTKLWWSSGMSLKNKFLATGMGVFQKIFGDASISSVITAFPDRGEAGVATNELRLYKGWLSLLRSSESYTLSANGRGVQVDAHVQFGPISFLFREHDVYPATVFDAGTRNLYEIRLLGTRFVGNYEVQDNRKEVHSKLVNDWSSSTEFLFKNG